MSHLVPQMETPEINTELHNCNAKQCNVNVINYTYLINSIDIINSINTINSINVIDSIKVTNSIKCNSITILLSSDKLQPITITVTLVVITLQMQCMHTFAIRITFTCNTNIIHFHAWPGLHVVSWGMSPLTTSHGRFHTVHVYTMIPHCTCIHRTFLIHWCLD